MVCEHRPIDLAPKDGTYFFGGVPGENMAILRWNNKINCFTNIHDQPYIHQLTHFLHDPETQTFLNKKHKTHFKNPAKGRRSKR
jgi:hypothetical protein